VIIVASRLKSKTDPVIIGSFLSPAAITYFYAGSRLLDYASEVVSSLAQIFVPMSSQSEAMGDQDRLRKIFVAGNRACALITLPMTAAFVIVGRSIIEVWLGKRYVAQGYSVLLTLIIPYTLMLTQFASGRVLYGMSKHGKVAIITVIEAAANIILSILLVRPFGIVGDAIGTAIPLAATYTLFMPFHLCSLLGIRMSSFLRQAFLLPLALALPPAMILLLMQRWLVPHTYRQLGLQLLIVGGIYAALLAWAHSAGKLLRVGNLALAGDSTAAEAIRLPVIETYSED
jgi:O-antigen/teichoic acid export membrane protein